MPVRRPTANELQDLAEGLGLHLEGDELHEIGALVDGMLGAIDGVEAFPEPERPARTANSPASSERSSQTWMCARLLSWDRGG